jgi:Phage Terminase
MEWAADLARIIDPAQTMRDLSFVPDDWQARLLRSRADRILLLCSRQLGKSTSTAVLALNEACYTPDSLVLLVSRSERQSALLFEKVSRFYKELRPVEAIKELSLSIKLSNGSEIVALPGDGDTIRGFSSPRLVILDEASRIPDAVMAAVVPMLVTNNGRLVALSTPRGRSGWFFEKWESCDPGWVKINARASESPRISAEALEEQRMTLGPRLFAAEFDNQFLEDVDSVFSAEAIASIYAHDEGDLVMPAIRLGVL